MKINIRADAVHKAKLRVELSRATLSIIMNFRLEWNFKKSSMPRRCGNSHNMWLSQRNNVGLYITSITVASLLSCARSKRICQSVNIKESRRKEQGRHCEGNGEGGEDRA